MSYVWSLVVVAVALGALAALVVGVLGPVRRAGAASALLSRDLGREIGMLRARTAALKVRMAERRAR